MQAEVLAHSTRFLSQYQKKFGEKLWYCEATLKPAGQYHSTGWGKQKVMHQHHGSICPIFNWLGETKSHHAPASQFYLSHLATDEGWPARCGVDPSSPPVRPQLHRCDVIHDQTWFGHPQPQGIPSGWRVAAKEAWWICWALSCQLDGAECEWGAGGIPCWAQPREHWGEHWGGHDSRNFPRIPRNDKNLDSCCPK